jgi:hypothetical protein
MITLLFLLSLVTLSLGSLSLGQYTVLRALKAKLAKLSATDDEIICILEATDSPLAKKLLDLTTRPTPPLPNVNPPPQLSAPKLAPSKKSARRRLTSTTASGRLRTRISDSTFGHILEECHFTAFDKGRIAIVESWLRKGYRFSDEQRVHLMRSMAFDQGRNRARALMDSFE